MKVVLQRVREARVTVEGRVVGEIGAGLMCLVGIGVGDSVDDIAWIRKRILGARLWPGADGRKRWDQNVTQLGYGVLLVSQFTLHGIFKGNKPDFHNSSARPRVPALARAGSPHAPARDPRQWTLTVPTLCSRPLSPMFERTTRRTASRRARLGSTWTCTWCACGLPSRRCGAPFVSCTRAQVNDGPVTMIVDSDERAQSKGRTPSSAAPTPTPTPRVEPRAQRGSLAEHGGLA